eukprot:CAMPEP_0117574302 /NCGR_PEP_ID=MMETSP0784-20121206/61496_1 /TAXON_ID=39447 /ORGANISM="" /LENGTH=40 /DNA_ID= /DNA_START= /DNA_END= /DNA_ORIENTATION=
MNNFGSGGFSSMTAFMSFVTIRSKPNSSTYFCASTCACVN